MSTTTPVEQRPAGPAARGVRDRLLARVDHRIHTFLSEQRCDWVALNPDSAELIDCVVRMVGSGGKRLRPAFCIAGYLAGGGDPDDPVIVDVSAALELLHTFALLHDDVMDDSALRRNKPTAHVVHSALHEERGWHGEHRRYGESVAVLAGNLALVYAQRLLASCAPPARRVWGELCTELMVGQFLDVRAAARFVPDPALSSWIAQFKSGRYTIYRPLAMGAELAGAPHLLEPFQRYGLALGEAFQLRDDLLDAFGAPGMTGKPAQLDFKQHKMTLLMSIALSQQPKVRELVGGDLSKADPAALHAVLINTGVRGHVEEIISVRLRTAERALDQCVPPVWAAELRDMAERVAHRMS